MTVTLLIFSLYNVALSYAQIFEDQLLVCDHTNECQIINIDDYINKDNATKLEYNFQHDLDTFDLK